MPTTLVDWTRLYRDCELRRTEEYRFLFRKENCSGNSWVVQPIGRCLRIAIGPTVFPGRFWRPTHLSRRVIGAYRWRRPAAAGRRRELPGPGRCEHGPSGASVRADEQRNPSFLCYCHTTCTGSARRAGPHAELRRDAILGCVPVVQYNPRLGALVLSPGTTEAGRVGGRGTGPVETWSSTISRSKKK